MKSGILLTSWLLIGCAHDPSPGIWQSKAEARSLECTRMAHAQAHALYPGRVPETPARSLPGGNTDALTCRRRFIRPDEREPRTELILTSLRQSVGDIVQVASSLGSGDLNWYVDAYYPDPRVAAKIAVAAKTDLAERGRKVSDRVPLLAAGDISVLGRLPPEEAHSLACKRYFAHAVLGERDAFLGLMIVDPREGQLHAGLCQQGKWRWVR